MIDIKVSITFMNPASNKEYTQGHTLPTIFISGGKNSVAIAIKKSHTRTSKEDRGIPTNSCGFTTCACIG